jgi:hypothetical protein
MAKIKAKTLKEFLPENFEVNPEEVVPTEQDRLIAKFGFVFAVGQGWEPGEEEATKENLNKLLETDIQQVCIKRLQKEKAEKAYQDYLATIDPAVIEANKKDKQIKAAKRRMDGAHITYLELKAAYEALLG